MVVLVDFGYVVELVEFVVDGCVLVCSFIIMYFG